MELPGFTAELSLVMTGNYNLTYEQPTQSNEVVPSQDWYVLVHRCIYYPVLACIKRNPGGFCEQVGIVNREICW
jgi:hypothetical protein